MQKFVSAYGKKTPYGVAFTKREDEADYVAPVLIAAWAHVVAQWTTAQILALVVDIDDVSAGEAYARALDLDLCPSRIVRTPHGAHVWYILDKSIKIIRTNNLLNPVAAASERLWLWAHSTLHALTTALGGDPASVSPCAYRRYPSRDVIHYDSDAKWSLSRLSQHKALDGLLKAQNASAINETADLRDVLLDLARYGDNIFSKYYYTPEGMRNNMCWKLAICSVILSGGNLQRAMDFLRPWAASCGYPERECQQCLAWAARSRVVRAAEDRGWRVATHEHRLDRATQAAVASAHASVRADERAEAAIAMLQEQGRPLTVNNIRAISGCRAEVVQRALSRVNKLI